MKKNRINAGWLMLLALSTLNLQPATALAQGTAFTYQGRLNNNGAPANGSYDFRFRLASDPHGNYYVDGPVQTNGVAVNNGLFVATLDFGSVFTGSNYWLEVDVRTNGAGGYTALSPLQPVTPATGEPPALGEFRPGKPLLLLLGDRQCPGQYFDLAPLAPPATAARKLDAARKQHVL